MVLAVRLCCGGRLQGEEKKQREEERRRDETRGFVCRKVRD